MVLQESYCLWYENWIFMFFVFKIKIKNEFFEKKNKTIFSSIAQRIFSSSSLSCSPFRFLFVLLYILLTFDMDWFFHCTYIYTRNTGHTIHLCHLTYQILLTSSPKQPWTQCDVVFFYLLHFIESGQRLISRSINKREF